MKYLTEICIGIDIAILGIAYPIVIDKISNIGDRYKSNYLSEVFKYEFPNYRLFSDRLSFFTFVLILTITSFIFLVIPIPPSFGWNNWLVNHSAELLTASLSLILTTLFFFWIDQLRLFNGKSEDILTHVISKYLKTRKRIEKIKRVKKKLKYKDREQYYLKTISEFAIYAIQENDEHIQNRLINFYTDLFHDIRNQYKPNTGDFEYPFELYHFLFLVQRKIVDTEKVRLSALEHRVASGIWLFGEDHIEIPISPTTYSWGWQTISLLFSKPKYVQMFWSNSHQYFSYSLQGIQQKIDRSSGQVSNKIEIEHRNKERHEFLEFHYALGGLLLHSEQYESIKYALNYTQSSPPEYALLPKSMDEIFKWFEDIRHPKTGPRSIGIKYRFPEVNSIDQDPEVRHQMCSFITLLFLRQFTLKKYYTFDNFITQPKLPDEPPKLSILQDNISYFKKCLANINEELLKILGYEKTQQMDDFIIRLESNVKNKLNLNITNAPISPLKLTEFAKGTEKTITQAIKNHTSFFQPFKNLDDGGKTKKFPWGIQKRINSKAPFTGNTNHLNFHTTSANLYRENIIKPSIANSLLVSRSKSYILKKSEFVKGFKALNLNVDNYIVIYAGLDYENKELLSKLVTNPYEISSHNLRDAIFIFKKTDAPSLVHLEIEDAADKDLTCIEKSIKLYTSVLDLNLQNYAARKSAWQGIEELEKNVEITIAMNTYILWKSSAKVIQLNVVSDHVDQGISNHIQDINPFDEK